MTAAAAAKMKAEALEAAKVAHSEKGVILQKKIAEHKQKGDVLADESVSESNIWEETPADRRPRNFEYSPDLKIKLNANKLEGNALRVEEEAHIAERKQLYPQLERVMGGRRKRGTRKVKRGKKGSRKGMRKGIRR